MRTIQYYIKGIKKTTLLSRERERNLALKFYEKIKGARAARKELIRANLRLVINIAKRYRHFGVPLMDLIEEGNIGLMKAVERFNPNKGYRFSTYAAWWIKQSIMRTLANQSKTIRIPLYMNDIFIKWERVRERLAQKLERPPTLKEIARGLHISQKKALDIYRSINRISSLDVPISDDDQTTFVDVLKDDTFPCPNTEIEKLFTSEHIEGLLAKLNEKQRGIIRLRYGLTDGIPHTLEEIAERYHITRERVRQIERVALKKLKEIYKQEEGE